MRLTLRTLLAYMDDILEPSDHEDLGKKIEASDFATELIHRSRDTVRRLRLGAPAVLSDGSDDVLDSLDLGDANSVAEYLDNTLPPEQVADFERLCLEPGTKPDMHLAEVASCHHVLTMVLGEPAEVDADLKSRMYQLPARLASGQKLRIESAHVAPQAAPPVQAGAPMAPPQASVVSRPAGIANTGAASHQELPDYLREAAASKHRSRRWAIAATLFAAVGAVFFWFASAPEAELSAELAKSGVEEFDDGEISIDIEGLNDSPIESTAGGEETMSEAPVFVPGEAVETAPPFDPGTPVVTADVIAPSETVAATEVDSPMEVEQPAVESKVALSATDLPTTDLPTMELIDEETTSEAAMAATTLKTVLPEGKTEPAIEEPLLVASAAGPSMTEETTALPEAAVADEPIATGPAGPQRLGSYLGNNDLLLIHNAAQSQWIRMPPRSPISTGDVLMTLPNFLTHVVLADINSYLSGGTRVRIPLEKFEASESGAELNLEIVYGRLLLNAGLKGSQVAMQLDDQLREFRMASSSSLAVDVERVFVPGSDYENEAAPIKATWYLTSGSVVWPTAAGGTQTIEAPAMWKTIDGIDEIPEQLDELPSWIDHELLTDMQRSAREDLAKELEAGRPVGIRLLELTEGKGLGRRKEVRMLAAASSVYVGEIEPLVLALNDSDQSRNWESLIKSMRQAIALSPDDAIRVRQAFVNIRGEESAHDLMDMVVGYSREQIGESREAIQVGALAQLIRWLDHDSLDYRVLAIHNIRETTGKSKGYRPDGSSKRRKINLRKIWDEFEAHELLK